jgi:hypothetical protein
MPLVTTTRGRIGVTGEQAHRMAGIQHKGLIIRHFREVAHGEQVLRPVLKHRPVAPIRDELMWVFGHLGIEVVLNHQHDGCCLLGAMRIVGHWPRVHGIFGPETVHINTSVALKFIGKFSRQFPVPFRGEVTQGVLNRQYLFAFRQNALDHTAWRVAHRGVERTGWGELRGYSGADGVVETI